MTKDATPELEDDLRQALGVDRLWLLSSGTAALTLTLQALKADRRRTEVVIPAYTCFSVPAAVLRAGLRPVPCDIDPRTFDLDPAWLARAIGPKTLCVVAHDLFGIPADIERIRRVCRSRDIAIVEDAAQGLGVEWEGRQLGTRADVGVFSFGRGKHVTCGSGGIVVTMSPRIAAAIDAEYRQLERPGLLQMAKDWTAVALMAVFIRPALFWMPAAVPWLHLGETIFPKTIRLARLSRMHAALLRDWRGRLARANRRRSELASELARRLSLDPPCGPGHPYLRLPVLAASPCARDRCLAESRARGLGLGRGYPAPVGEIPEVAAVIGHRRFAAATRVADHLLTVPTHHWVSSTDADAIVECLGRGPDAGVAVRQKAS